MNDDELRSKMVEEQLIKRNIEDIRVLTAMRHLARHEFIPPEYRHLAYEDRPVAIGHQQTISQPFMVAVMLQLLQLSGHETVLEIGTGSGYLTALLCELCAYVYSMERQPDLADQAADRLATMGYTNVDLHVGDGSQGLADMSPYDAIVVSASVPSIPGPLRAQMRPLNSRLILPVGRRDEQILQVVRRDVDQWHIEDIFPVRFVPLIGLYGFQQF